MQLRSFMALFSAFCMLIAPHLQAWNFTIISSNISNCFRTIKGSGKIVTENRAISDFKNIQISNSLKSIITQSSVESVTVKADDNIIDRISTENKNGTLYIELKSGSYENLTAELKISVKELEKLNCSGAADVEVNNYTGDALEVTSSGASKVHLNNIKAKSFMAFVSGASKIIASGQANKQKINLSGASDYKGYNFRTEHSNVTSSGASNAFIHAIRSLKAHASGASDIRYHGHPEILEKEASGASSIKQN